MNLFIVDPSNSYRNVIKLTLSNEDTQITEASNGNDGLAHLKNHKPSAICVAHELGDMDSFKFLKKLKLNKSLSNTPKFLLTSNSSPDFKRQAYDAGFTEIFIKSDFPTLKRALHSLMVYATLNISARVLYVEDTQSTADFTSHIMQSVGWKVKHVKSGEEAAKILDNTKKPFDIVVTDLVLEGEVSGIGLINLIRQGNERIRDIPILAVSGWNDLLRQVYVLKHGAGDFIAKPFNETDFLARAINLIMGKRARDELINQQEALYQKANIDSLTGINNRHFLDEYAEKLIKSALAKNEGVTLMLLDIDQFKDINDMMGHPAGDTILKTVASILKNNSHSNDIIARYGGDEFVVIIKDLNQQEVLERAETIRQQVAEAEPLGIAATCSIGLACHDKKIALQLVELLASIDQSPEDIELNYQALFKAADHSLYAAKKAGRNRVCMNNLLNPTQ
ncbi:diguanylate cyclase [Thiomicrorhabdus lithotrophica]|uniref:diguanylate cyclase n=1 Tax=Thiomicrorhabdus lithotrophica TaxID=2949997 RepID=A0ABY8CGA2_9GAMM|nr:diguanylate cyclase [Thiomicrorhabdus lithotrophica]WEJ63478.1 diguanylate cyclase [Thiomicrorhabdus lithotrophica]